MRASLRGSPWWAVFVLTVAALLAVPAASASGVAVASAAGGDEPCPSSNASEMYLDMSDGVRLKAALRWPRENSSDTEWCNRGPQPALLQFSHNGTGHDSRFPTVGQAGYVLVTVSIRGTGCSGGEFDQLSRREILDIHEVIDWIASRSWSDGRVLLAGQSYRGIMALSGAPGAPKALRAVVAIAPSADFYRDTLVPGGIRNLFGVSFGATLAAVSLGVGASGAATGDAECVGNAATPSVPFIREALLGWEWDEGIIHDRSPIRTASQISVPVFLGVGWHDEWVGSRAVDILRELRVPYHAMLVNGGHLDAFGGGLTRAIVKFADHYVRGVPGYDQPAVEIGWDSPTLGTPRWTTTHASWPLPRAQTRKLYLAENGTLTDAKPSATGTDTYAYTPGRGQGTSSHAGWASVPPPGTYRAYTYDVREDLVVAGSASLDVWLSSTATDTDLQVILAEVHGGVETYVAQGFLRASHRRLDEKRSSPTRPYHTHLPPALPLLDKDLLRVEVMPFAHAFRKGSQLRIYVEAPRAADLWALEAHPEPAVNRIHRGGPRPSALVLSQLPHVTPDAGPTTCHESIRRLCRPAVVPVQS